MPQYNCIVPVIPEKQCVMCKCIYIYTHINPLVYSERSMIAHSVGVHHSTYTAHTIRVRCDDSTHTHTHTHIYIYIYIYICTAHTL